MRDNKLTKILLIILIIVCLFQGCSISAMSTNMEDMNNQLVQANVAIQNLQYRLNDVEDTIENNRIQRDYSYEVKEINWNDGKVLVDFSIQQVSATEDTRIVIGNGYGVYELEKNGNQFKGTVEYPMNAKEYETIVYQYEGDFEKNMETIDYLSAGYFLMEKIGCKFDGFASYGNGKLTLAGELNYGFNLNDTISSIKFVVGDTSTEIEKSKTGSTKVNISESVGSLTEMDMEKIRLAYLEFTTESQNVYRVYPAFSADADYKVDKQDGEIMGDFFYQDSWLVVSLSDGTEYEMLLNAYTDADKEMYIYGEVE